MTTELINELRSAAATLRKPFPARSTPASDLAAAELLERAAEKIQETEFAVMAAASEVTRWKRIYDDYARAVGQQAAALYRDQSKATHRAKYWRRRAKRAERRLCKAHGRGWTVEGAPESDKWLEELSLLLLESKGRAHEAASASMHAGLVARDVAAAQDIAWGAAPEWANFLAMDANGKWIWYENRPYQHYGVWDVEGGQQQDAAVAEGWEHSLQQRPVTQPTAGGNHGQ